MRRVGWGGDVLFDGVSIAQVTSWNFSESPSTRDELNSTDTTVNLDLIFYEGFDSHTLPIGTVVEITLDPSIDDSSTFTILKARVTARSGSANPNTLVTGSLSLISRYAPVYS